MLIPNLIHMLFALRMEYSPGPIKNSEGDVNIPQTGVQEVAEAKAKAKAPPKPTVTRKVKAKVKARADAESTADAEAEAKRRWEYACRLSDGKPIPGNGYRVPDLCVDRTEVTVASYAAYLQDRRRNLANGDFSTLTRETANLNQLEKDLERISDLSPTAETPDRSQEVETYSKNCTYRGRTKYDDAGEIIQQTGGKDDYPMNCITIVEAEEYCAYFQKRLPTREEWEWAARNGPADWKYPWGNDPPSASNVHRAARDGDLTGTPDPVRSITPPGQEEPLYHLGGNVAEFTQCPKGGSSCQSSGGHFRNFLAPFFRVTYTNTGGSPAGRSDAVGFRCVADRKG